MKKVSKVFPQPVRTPSARSFSRDEGGAVAVLLALMLAALLGMMGLAMDLGKVWNLETQLQHAADAGALAGVTQLDGSDGARVRAIRAVVSELANNTQIFARDNVDADALGGPDGLDIEFDATEAIDGGGIATNRDIKFYDNLPIDPANESTSDADARFIEVNVWPRTTPFSFAAVVGAVSSASPGARAVAGWDSFFCDSPPMMMCNPNELTSPNSPPTFNFDTDCPDDGDGTSCVGRGITMKARAGAPEPGDFGYLALQTLLPDGTVDTVTGVPNLLDALASVVYGNVCTGNQVTTEPGNMAALDQAINQRFDLYPDLATAQDANRQPAPNVGRGLLKKASFDPAIGKCKFAPQTPASPGDWKRPEDAGTTEDRGYRGPGKHARQLPGGGTLLAPPGFGGDIYIYGDVIDSNLDVVHLDGNSMGEMNPPIWAMAYPKDTCNYTWADTDEPAFEAEYFGTLHPDLLAGAGGCLFKAPPADPTPESPRQVGTGQWDIQVYLDVYHPGMTEADFLDETDFDNYADALNNLNDPTSRDGKISRWELYNWEKKPELLTYPNMAFEEEPVCYSAPVPNDFLAGDYTLPQAPAGANTADRRIIVMAVVNCDAMGGGRRTVPRTQPTSNVAVFLTEPMGYTLPDTLYGELVDPLGLGIGELDTNPTLVRERIVLIE